MNRRDRDPRRPSAGEAGPPRVSWDRDPRSFWLGDRDGERAPLAGEVHADVVIVGAGFTGLGTAIALHDRDPRLRLAVLEAHHAGYGASGRNGGFVEATLTHGLANGLAHFPDENDELLRLGRQNLAGLIDFVRTVPSVDLVDYQLDFL